ncbi:MAG TPA: gamma-glutamylcyclotransferase [Candidatus Berkiella sp.]|nr:gamma-glutamylcyclotransferase [Candidatus Berkiella sp.]
MKYFAYGEMMFSAKLHHIVPEATCLGIAKVMGYKLFFHNRGHDDASGKCNIVPVKDPNCEVYGVIYEINNRHRYLLDKDQSLGCGSQEITLKVWSVKSPDTHELASQENGIFAFTYIAHKDNIFEDLVPYNWYKEMILSGAKEHHLPSEYIHHLEQYAETYDPNVQRANRQKRYLESILL